VVYGGLIQSSATGVGIHMKGLNKDHSEVER